MAEPREDQAFDIAARDRRFPDVSNGAGAGDANNGGGAGSGVPDAETALRTDAVTKGDTARDREKLFPEADTHRPADGAK